MPLAIQDRQFNGCIVRNHAARDGHRCLEQGNGGDVGGSQLIGKTISVSIDIQPKAFLGLRAVVMVHGIIGELTDGNDRARLMVGQYDQARWVVAGGLQAGGRQAYDFRGVPRAVGIVGQRLPPTSPPFPRYRQRWPFLAA